MKRRSRDNLSSAAAESSRSLSQCRPRRVSVRVEPFGLPAQAFIPEAARGWVVAASSGSRHQHSDLERRLLERLSQEGFATLQLNLLRDTEGDDPLVRFDIPLLAKRLDAATGWLRDTRQPHANLVAYLTTGNATAAALWCSVQSPGTVAAVVSLAGRPHLAEPFLGQVACPTLLAVPGEDRRLLHVNQQAEKRLHCSVRLIPLDAAPNPSRKTELWKPLISEIVSWINQGIDGQKKRGLSLSSLLTTGLAAQLRRQILAGMTFLSFSLAVPASARAESDGKQEIKKDDVSSQPARRDGRA